MVKSAEVKQEAASKRAPGSLAELFYNWRYFFLLLGLIGLVVLFYAEENWRGEWLWMKYQRQQEANGDTLKPSAFIPPPILDEENFTMAPSLNLYLRGQTFATKYDAAASNVKGQKGSFSNSWVKAKTDLRVWHAAFLLGTNQSARNDRLMVNTNETIQTAAESVLASLAEADRAIAGLRIASQRPRSRFSLNYGQNDPASILLPHLAPLRHFCQVLQLRASAELVLGRTAEAADEIKLMLYLANACRDEPILVSQLVRVAQLNLALQPLAEGMNHWSDPQLQEFQGQLRQFDFCADAQRTLQAERVFFGGQMIEYFRHASDKLQMMNNFGNQTGGYEIVGGLMAIAPNGWFSFEHMNYCRTFAEALLPVVNVAEHRVSPTACKRGEVQISKTMAHSPLALYLRHKFFCGMLMPSLSRAVWRMGLGQTAAEEASVACALERFRLAHGQYPDSLDSLAPGFIEKLPHDIINGQPLKYRRTDDGKYVLYSVGWNEKDDGGLVEVNKSGEGLDLQAGDWVWRPVE